MRNKLTVVAGGLLAVWLGWMSWRHAASAIATSPDALRPDVPYSLAVANYQSVFDLEFGPHDCYRLLISNFGAVDDIANVSVRTESVDKLERFPGERVIPLSIRPLTVGEAPSRAAAGNSTSTGMQLQQPPAPPLGRLERILPVGYVVESQDRDFHLHVTDGALENPEGYVRVTGVVIAEGARSRVYLDRQERQSPAMARLAQELVQVLEDDVMPRTKATLGVHRDVDGDGKLSLLLTPWLGKLQGGETTLKGFTRSTDFRMGIPAPFSNQCDVIYLNSQLRPGPMLRDLLAHEYAHAVSFSIRQGAEIGLPSLPEEEDWLNEGIAHLAENLSGSGWTNLDYRVSRYLDDPEHYPLIVPDYYRAGLWREHGCRGATYLFLRWCADVWGNHLPAALLRSPAAGTISLERLTGVPFPQLYRHFNLAVASAGRTVHSAAGSKESVKSIHAFETISLYGRLGNWQLAGPRWEVLDVNVPASRNLELRGTATAFVELRTSIRGGVRRVHVEGKPGSHLQVTLIRYPPDTPALEISATWEPTAGSAGSTDVAQSNSVAVLVENTVESTRPVQIETVVLEQNHNETRRSIIAIPAGTAAPLGATGGRTRLRFVVPREAVLGSSNAWRVKVVGQDPLGIRVSATVTLPEWQSNTPGLAGRDGATRRL